MIEIQVTGPAKSGKSQIINAIKNMALKYNITVELHSSVDTNVALQLPFDGVILLREATTAKPIKVAELKPRDPTWIQRMYSLTNEFHTKTGVKVRIQDLLDAFFSTSMSGLEIDDQEAFEARLRERLQKQVPGWDK